MDRIKEILKREIEVKEDPRLLPKYKKIFVVICVILAGTVPGLASTVYFPGLPEIKEDLNASSIGITSSTSLFILFQGFFPIIWSSISDYFHVRKLLFMISLTIFALASLASCFVQNIWVLVFFRCVQSVGASASACLGAGTIADLYPVEQRGTAMGMLFFGVFVGPLIGPNIGGGLTFYWSWRATFYFCLFYSSFVCLLIFFFTIETYRPASFDSLSPSPSSLSLSPSDDVEMSLVGEDRKKDEEDIIEEDKKISIAEEGLINNDNDNNINNNLSNNKNNSDKENLITISPSSSSPSSSSSFNPFLSLFLLSYPFVALTSLSTGVAFGSMFTIETILPDLFDRVYHLNSWQIGLCYLGGGLGNLVGSLFGGRYLDYVLAKKKKEKGESIPEDRLALSVFVSGFIIQPFGCLLFTWSIEAHWHLAFPIAGFSLVCFGMTQILLSGSTYLVDATGKGASATAAANSIRNLFACVLSLVASPMLQKLGSGYIGVLSAALSVIVTSSLLYNKHKGPAWRKAAGFSTVK